MSMQELERKVTELKSLQALMDEINEQAEALKDAIKAHMGDTELLRVGDHKVRWQTVKSTRLDTAALKRDQPEVVQAYTRTTATRRFSVA